MFHELVLMATANSQIGDAKLRHGCAFVEDKPVVWKAVPRGLMRLEEQLGFRGNPQ
jgi:hypothetical protein